MCVREEGGRTGGREKATAGARRNLIQKRMALVQRVRGERETQLKRGAPAARGSWRARACPARVSHSLNQPPHS
eukprot:548315-Rhodomonas_salina.1